MPRASVASVTASALKRKPVIIAASCGLIVLVILLAIGLRVRQVGRDQHQCRLQLEKTCLSLEFATTQAQLIQGLSGRKSMAQDHGMLFDLRGSDAACFWMKDMNFPLDIIWIDAHKKVINVSYGATPDSYPQSYCPDSIATYVLEVNALVANRNNIKTGSQLNF